MIGIVTVVTNEKYNLDNFFRSLSAQSFKDFTLYFIDNNSSDGSADYFRHLNKNNELKVKFLSVNENSGFSTGSNNGASAAIQDGCEYLFILNNDVELDKNCLAELKTLIESSPDIVCVGPLLFMHKEKFPGIIQEYGGKINFRSGMEEKYYTKKNINEVSLPEILESDFVGGGVCFIKADAFKNAGMFEDSYFAYFDEIDLAYRLRMLRQYKMYVTAKAIAYHNHYWTKKNNKSYYFEYYLSERNKFLYFKKFKLYYSIIWMTLIDLLKFPWRLVWFMKVCDFKLGLYYLKGMKDGLLGRKGKPSFI